MFKMLLIGDKPTYSSEISSVMKGFCQLHTTSSATIGFNLAAANKYDLIMIDIDMHSGNSGVEAAHSITKTETYASVPIVAFSVGKIMADKDLLFSYGFTHIISEPYNMRNFAQQIKFIISSQLNSNHFSPFLSSNKPLAPKLVY
jgi:CheY-like chemotaxis protein